MNEKVENLVLEQLRLIRTDIGKLAEDVRSIKTEPTAMRHHQRGFETAQDGHYEDIAVIKVRLDRIERRLELADEVQK